MSKCDYCDNTKSCQTCGLTYDDGVKDGRKQAIKELVNVAGRQNMTAPDDRLVFGAIVYAVDILGRKFADDMTSSHSESAVYKGCLDLMGKMVEYFYEYLEFVGYDVEKEDPDERFLVSFMPTEIVRKLFLSGTGHDGGTSCRMKCKELGIEAEDDRQKAERMAKRIRELVKE